MLDPSIDALFDQIPVGVFAVNAAGFITRCNDAFLVVTGTTREKIIGFDFRKVKDQRIVPAMERALGGEASVYEGPYDTTTVDAHLIVLIRCQPFRLEDGSLSGFVATWEDATERVRTEQALRHQIALIEEQSTTIRALGAPILKVWKGILCMPVIGLVSDERAHDMTESLLEAIIAERASFAIIDLTGVETVDTTTAHHLVQLFRAVSLVGAEAVLSGMGPAVAQTIVTLDIDMTRMRTTPTLYAALRYCTQELLRS